jgi:O-antigen ligase
MLIVLYLYFKIEFNKLNKKSLESFLLNTGKFYIFGSLLFYILGIYVYSVHPGIPEDRFYFGLMQENILPRLKGFAESPNSFIPFALFFLVYFMDKRQNIWILITLLTILLSFSTTGMIIAFILFGIFYIDKISLKKIFYLVLLFIVIVIIFSIYIQNNQEIMAMIEWRMERNRTGTGRFELWGYALSLIDNNIFGYGINTTRLLIQDFHALASVHNSIVEIFLTGGFIALFLYLLLYLVVFFQSLYIWKYKQDKKMLLLFIVFVLIGMANNTLHIGYVIFYLSVLQYYTNSNKELMH